LVVIFLLTALIAALCLWIKGKKFFFGRCLLFDIVDMC
jgi:hypothetical protein